MAYLFHRPALVLALAITSVTAHGQSPHEVATRLGITPESTTVAGFQPGQVQLILAVLQQADGLCQALEAARDDLDAAASAVTDGANSLRAVPGDASVIAQYQEAVQQLATTHGVLDGVQDQLAGLATNGASNAHVQRLIAWRSGSTHVVPAEFRVRERSSSEWKAIVRALRAEARAERLDEDLGEQHAALLESVRSDPLVVEASQLLESNLVVMQAIFQQFSD